MFSIALNRIYLAVLGLATMALTYQGLVRVFTDTPAAINYGLGALMCGVLFGFVLHRWMHLEYLWTRALMLLVPPKANPTYRELVKKNLNHVLSQKVFRMEMRRVLNAPGVFKIFMDQGTPTLQLDIAFPDRWKNHNYLRSALGWIATCMPATMMCQTVECKDTRLVFRFVARDAQNKDKEPLHEGMREWKTSMQSLLVMRLDKCSVQSIAYVPQKLVRKPKSTVPAVPTTAFEEDVLLAKEQVRLHIGFNGSTYYTYFQDQARAEQESNRREYASWEALWSVWQHMSEVQDAFMHVQDASAKGARAPAKAV